MDGIWHLDAPQWTDFESSPQIPDDDYFEREHEGLEPQPQINEVVPAVETHQTSEKNEIHPTLKINLLEIPGENDALINEIEIAKMTPVKVVSPRSRNKKHCKTKETTYQNVLSEAMASLQLSIKKKARRSQSARNMQSNITATPTNVDKVGVAKALNLTKGPRSTPSNPIPMWIRKTRPSESGIDDNQKNATLGENRGAQDPLTEDNPSLQDTLNNEDPEIDKDLVKIEPEEPVGIVAEDLAADQQPQDSHDSNELKEDINVPEINDIQPLTDAPLPGPSKRSSNNSQRSGGSNRSQPARFSTCQLRRRSLTQYRRRSNKYVSLAEAISSFQNKTPVRFRSVSLKNAKPGPVQKIRQSTVSVTVPISPALRCKSRTRATVPSQEERERLEIEQMKKHAIRENLARTSSMKTLAQNLVSKTTAKKPATHSEHNSQATERKTNARVNRESRLKVTVPSVVSTDDGIAVKDAEISNFGVPDITISKLTTTKAMPFSFEMRNKQLQQRKEKKIKELMTEEEKKTKVAFHARPVPSFKKPMLAATKEASAAKPRIKPCPFSFEERDKNLIKKKENLLKTALEEDKKARIFQAKPIPEFKPVLVRGISKENINSGNKPANPHPPQKTRISMLPVAKTGSRNCLLVKANVSNQENLNPLPKQERPKSHEPQQKTVLAEFHLNTDKRARDRKEFDERIKQKEQEIELLKKEAEAEKLKRDETERAEIRKMAAIKARPMPAYKPPAVIHSDKPLTEPQSPGWSTKPKR